MTLQSATLAAYAASYGAFERWCRAQGHRPLPAVPGAISTYLAKLVAEGKAPATVAHALDGIGHVQRRYDPAWQPHEIILKVVADARQRSHVEARGHVGAIDFKKLVEGARSTGGMRGLRDAALLLLGHYGNLRRSKLVSLDVRDVRVRLGRLVVGNLIVLSSKDPDICAVGAVQMWIFAAKFQSGPLFRAISKTGSVLDRRLNGKSVSLIAKRAARHAGIDESRISSDTLRLETPMEISS